jgi:undecaprenyl-diphosphatase
MPRRLLIIAAAPAVLFVTLTALVAGRVAPVLTFDAVISAAARRAATGHPSWRSFGTAVTNTGGPAAVTVLAAASIVILLVVGRRRDAAFVIATMLGSAVLRLIILSAVGRERPIDRLAPAAGFSYPSGHTTGSAAAALTAIVVLWPILHGDRRVLVTIVAGLWAFAVGASRVALVVHWPTDVLGAWLLATTVVLLALPVRGGLRRSGPGPAPYDEAGSGGHAESGPGAGGHGEFGGSGVPAGSEPGVGHRDELGGGDRGGRGEDEGEGEKAGETLAARPGSRIGQGLHAPDDDAAADAE